MKLEKLAQEQLDLMPIIRDRWIKWALTPTETNREKIKQNLIWLYKQINLGEPENIIVCLTLKDFLTSVGASVRASVWASVWASVRDSVRTSVRTSVWTSVRDSVRDSVRASVRASVWASVRDSVWASVGDSVWDSVWDSVGDSVGDSVWASVRASVWASVGAYYWADDLAFANYFEEIGILTDKKLIEQKNKYATVLKDLSLGFLTEKTCIVLVKPQVFRNESGQLHNDQGLSVKWADGDGFYFLDGLKFEPERWARIVKKEMPFGLIMQIENADHRAIALKYNPEAILNAGSVLIDKSTRGNELFLIEGEAINEFLEEPEIYFLRMQCPTGRTFIEGVDPEIARKNKSADFCQAYALGLDLNQYNHLRMEG